jgi:hypothetical protein
VEDPACDPEDSIREEICNSQRGDANGHEDPRKLLMKLNIENAAPNL